MQIYYNPDGSHMNKQQIINDIIQNDRIGDDMKSLLKNGPTPHNNMVDIFDIMSFYRWIRNSYGIWDTNNPHTVNVHPDDFSYEIVQELTNVLKEEEDDRIGIGGIFA